MFWQGEDNSHCHISTNVVLGLLSLSYKYNWLIELQQRFSEADRVTECAGLKFGINSLNKTIRHLPNIFFFEVIFNVGKLPLFSCSGNCQ